MKDAVERLNDWALTVLGLVLVAVGGYGLARGYGAFGEDPADDAVLGKPIRNLLSRNAGWFWPLAVVVSLLLAYVGLRWLLGQVRSGHISHLDLTDDPARGTTVVRATSAADALAGDVGRYPGVGRARARLLRDGIRPHVDIQVEVYDDADLADVRRRIESHALARLRQALEVEDPQARVRFRLSESVTRAH